MDPPRREAGVQDLDAKRMRRKLSLWLFAHDRPMLRRGVVCIGPVAFVPRLEARLAGTDLESIKDSARGGRVFCSSAPGAKPLPNRA